MASKSSKYQPIYDLGEDAVLQIERFIQQGMALKTLAERMHTHGMITDKTTRQLATLLRSYKRDVMDRGLMKSVEESGILDAQRKGSQMNLHEELMTTLALQRNRVEAVARLAQKNPDVLIEQHGKEVKHYHEMLDKTARVQMDLGIIQRPPRRQTMQVMRDAQDGKVVRVEVTDEVLDAVTEIEGMFGDDLKHALPAPSSE